MEWQTSINFDNSIVNVQSHYEALCLNKKTAGINVPPKISGKSDLNFGNFY